MDIAVVIYAVILAAGGIYGFLKAGSTMSLIMSLTFAGLVAFFEYKRQFWMTFACCVTLAIIMGYRSLNSGKFMPAGLVASLSALMVVNLLAKYAKQRS